MGDRRDRIVEQLFVPGSIDLYDSRDKRQDHLLAQYQLYVQGVERISDRRQSANAFFVSVNTAVLAFLGYANVGLEAQGTHYSLAAAAGVAISFMWYRLIRSYRDLNSAKFQVIHAIGEKLPLRPYAAEWEAVGRGKDSSLYLPFTRIEVGIPWVFLGLHALSLLQLLTGQLISR